jgi:SRSO17 transposase
MLPCYFLISRKRVENGRIRLSILASAHGSRPPKKGKHSVGVARQYCNKIGKQDNCQVAVTSSVASDHASLPVAFRL